MKSIIELQNDWVIRGKAPQSYRPIQTNAIFQMEEVLDPGKGPGFSTLTLPGEAPGCVHLALQKTGVLKDLFYRDHVNHALWVEQWDWTYEKEFIWKRGEQMNGSNWFLRD